MRDRTDGALVFLVRGQKCYSFDVTNLEYFECSQTRDWRAGLLNRNPKLNETTRPKRIFEYCLVVYAGKVFTNESESGTLRFCGVYVLYYDSPHTCEPPSLHWGSFCTSIIFFIKSLKRANPTQHWTKIEFYYLLCSSVVFGIVGINTRGIV
jgi:hypothetical protein